MIPTKFQVNWPFDSGDLQVTPMLSIVSNQLDFDSGKKVRNGVSRWPPRPAILDFRSEIL